MQKKKQVFYKNIKIAYTKSGNGKVIVLLHGFLEDLTMWDELVGKFSVDNTVISIDLPGFGESGMISMNHSMDDMADAVAAVINNEKVSKCILVGHSMGGYVALAFANKYENKLRGIVLFHSQAAADDEKTKINRDRTIKIVENNHANFISAFIPSLFSDENAIKFSGKIQQIVEKSLLIKNEGIIAALAGMRDRDDFTNLLLQLDVPVLFIVGKKDTRIPLDKISKQIILPKISESLILDSVGHMGFIEAQELTCNAIVGFAKRY